MAHDPTLSEDLIDIEIPFKDGSTRTIKMHWEVFVPSQGRNMTFYEYVLNPATAPEAAHLINQEIKKQIKYSPDQIMGGFLDQMFQGATLGWSEEIGSYIGALPRLMPGGMTYQEGIEDYRTRHRTSNDMMNFLYPKTSAVAQGVGLALPIAASIVEPGLSGEAAVGAYSAQRATSGYLQGTRNAMRAMNPFGIAGQTVPATISESILKAMVLGGTHALGADEGYLKDRIDSLPDGLREGAEWGLLANVVLFGGMAAWQGMMKIPGVRTKMREMNFLESLGPDFVAAIARGDTTALTKLRNRALETIVEKNALDINQLRSGVAPKRVMEEQAAADLANLESARVPSELTLGEQGGPHLLAQQQTAVKGEPVSGLNVVQQLEGRSLAEPQRISAALRENQPTTLLTSADEALLGRERRVSGTEAGEKADLVGILGAEKLESGVADIYYARGYEHNALPLAGEKGSGGFMKMFEGWTPWKELYNAKDWGAKAMRECRIANHEAEAYTPSGLSNQLPTWEEFLAGIRYIPKSSFKTHGRTINEQLNPKTGLWQEYKKSPRKGWKTRRTVVSDEFKIVQEQRKPGLDKNGKPHEWKTVAPNRDPTKGYEVRRVDDGNSWKVRLNDKSISFETLHDLRGALDVRIAELEAAGQTKAARQYTLMRGRLDSSIKANPDMARADHYFSELRNMETAAKAGYGAWTGKLNDMVRAYEKMGPNEKRMFRTAFIENAEARGYTAEQLTSGRIGESGQILQKLRVIYPEGEAGTAMYNRMLDDLNLSKVMQRNFEATPRPTAAEIAAVGDRPKGLMNTLRLMAKIPAYKFSQEFALGRDLIEQARRVDATVRTGVAKELNQILSTKSGTEAALLLDDLASTHVRMRGNVPMANGIRAMADTMRSVAAYEGGGVDVSKMPPVEGVMAGDMPTPVDIDKGTWGNLLSDYDLAASDYGRNYPATAVASSLLENVAQPTGRFLRKKWGDIWGGPQ